MSEMVERVAKAICISVGRDPTAPFRDHNGKPLDFPEWRRWEGEARAAIAAMREPTPEMVQAGDAKDDCTYGGHNASAECHWRAMIDEALK